MTTAQELQQAASQLRDALHARDQLVARMRHEGATIRQIAAAAGLSPQGVVRILERTPR
jgi:hypothetical protein